MNTQRLFYIILLTFTGAFSYGQNAAERQKMAVGLYSYQIQDGPFTTGYNFLELKEFPIAISWSDGKIGDPQSNLGTWSLEGDTIIITFHSYTLNCIWRRGYDVEPNFCSKLAVLSSDMIYQRVSPNKLMSQTIVNIFTVKGKAIKKKGVSYLEVNLSDTINLHLDSLSSWKKPYLNRKLLVHGTIEQTADKKLIMKKWSIIHVE